MDADRLQPRLRRHLAVQAARLLERNAELVDVQAGRDVRMRAGVDVRVDAHRHPGAHASRLRRAIDALQLACGLGVDRFEPELHRALDLVGRLADAAEHDVRWREAGAHRQLDFADGVGVDGAAGLAQQARRPRTTSSPSARSESGADAPRNASSSSRYDLPNRLGAVDVERRAVLARDIVRAARRRTPARCPSRKKPTPRESYITVRDPLSRYHHVAGVHRSDHSARGRRRPGRVGHHRPDVLAQGLQRRVPVRRHVRRSGRSRRRRSFSRSFDRSARSTGARIFRPGSSA